MGLTVTTPAKTVLLSTVARVKAEFGISGSSDDALLDVFVRQGTDAVEKFCNRVFARQKYPETAPAFGGPYFMTRQAPVVELTSTARLGETLTDVSVEDVAQGLLYRQDGFDWTAQRYSGLLAAGGWLDQGMPIPLSEEPNYTLVYTAGFIVPAQNLLSVATVSVDTSDDSFNDSASGFPALLKAGDIIETSGFTNAANNGRFKVLGTPTTAKIVVEANLTTEIAAAGRTVLVSTLPGDVERGCIEVVKSLWAKRSVDGSIVQRTAGPMSIRHSEGMASEQLGIPPSAVGLLHSYVRRTA